MTVSVRAGGQEPWGIRKLVGLIPVGLVTGGGSKNLRRAVVGLDG